MFFASVRTEEGCSGAAGRRQVCGLCKYAFSCGGLVVGVWLSNREYILTPVIVVVVVVVVVVVAIYINASSAGWQWSN